MTADLAAADEIAAALAWLRQHATVLSELGDATHISGTNEGPYPHVMLRPSAGGDDGELRWLRRPELLVATLGDLDGTPGQAELRRLHYGVLAALTELAGTVPAPGVGVVSRVRPSSAARYEPQPLTGQPAWLSTLILHIHPPAE